MKRDQGPTRREFTLTLTGLAGGAGLAAAAPQQKPTDPLATAARALEEIIRLRYGRFLTAEKRQAVLRELQYNLQAGERLKRFPLKNGDEPAFIFQADV